MAKKQEKTGQTISTKVTDSEKEQFSEIAENYRLNPSQALTRLIHYFIHCSHEERMNLIEKYHDPTWPQKNT